jgi:hypothetical protein
MNAHSRKAFRRLGLLAAVVLIVAASRPAALRAASPVASLEIVPDDAAFYSAMLRNREQLDAVANSRAWAKIKALQIYQMAMGLYQMQAASPDSPAGYLQAAMDNPEARKSLGFLGDLLSDEVFVYGGQNFNKFVELYQTVYWSVQMSSMTAAMEAAKQGHAPPPGRSEEIQARALVQSLSSQVDNIQLPDLVIGLKCKDKDFAKQLLNKLETNLQPVFASNPMLAGRLKRETVAGHSYLTLNLQGDMIPWDPQVEGKILTLATSPAEGGKLIYHLKKLKLVLSLGLRDDFLIVALGPSTDVLTRLGGSSPLAGREELASVKKYADERLTAVTYSSKIFNQHFSPSKADIDQLASVGKQTLKGLPVPDKLKEELGKTVAELAADLKSIVTEIGATSSVGFLTKRGSEGYFYDWSEHPEIDFSKPLDLLKHVGGNPIAVVVGRAKVRPGDYDMLVKWLTTAYRYAEEYGVPQIPPKERPHFDKFVAGAKPLLARVDKTIRDLLMPALADGQTALVIDAKLTSRQFIKSLPPTEQPMPMIEPAIVVGVSDAAKLKDAFKEFSSVADDFVDLMKSVDYKHALPADLKIPRPKEFNLKSGKVWGYTLPAEAGVDTRVMPNAGLSDNVGVLSMSGRHTQRLLAESEPSMAGIKLPTDKACGTVAAFDFTALLDAATPWVDFAMAKAAEQEGAQGQGNAEMVKQHVKTLMEVLRCYHGTVAVTYQEGKVIVTRSQSEFKDIQE